MHATDHLTVAAGGLQSPAGAEAACAELLAIEARRTAIKRRVDRIERQVRRARSVMDSPLWLYLTLLTVSVGFAVWAFTVSTAVVQVIAVIALAFAVHRSATAVLLIITGPRWTEHAEAELYEGIAGLEQCRVDAEAVAGRRWPRATDGSRRIAR